MKTTLFILIFVFTASICEAIERPKIIVLTDIGGDTDDEQSMVRFLLYADVFDIKAICATSRLGHGKDTKPELIRKQIEAYRSVYPNLLLHSENFPSPDYLSSLVKNGQGEPDNFGDGLDSEVSDFIIKTVDDATETVHLLIWGGQRELAQALWKIRATRPKEKVTLFCKKMQVHAIGDQDKHRDWILDNFKHINYIANGYAFHGNFGTREISVFRGMYMTGDVSMQDREWVKNHIHGHGALGDCYPLDGHGTNGMKEGDSPSFLGLIANGLNVPTKPEWGGWGGRFRRLSNNLYIDGQDFLDGTLNERHTVSRWRLAFQRDFMARLDWCVESYGDANHNPVVSVNGNMGKNPMEINAEVGEQLAFDASDSIDPDNDSLSFDWFFYNELSQTDCLPVTLESDGEKCIVEIPSRLSGRSLHLILEVRDNGTPSLSSYRRIVVHVD